MLQGRSAGGDQPAGNQEFMTFLLNIQQRMDEQAVVMQQQAAVIQDLQ